MRNLSLVSYRELSTSLTGSPSSYAIDSDRDGAWITCTQHKLHFIDFTSGKVECVTELADHVTSSDVIVGLEYLSEMGVVCIATRNGEVLTYNTATHEVESVGSVSDGISCMGWSPYQDLVVMATGQDNLLLMTREFDPLTELSMHPHEYGDALPVTVGWGKKETQFHGSLGKPKGSQVGGVTHQVTMGERSWDDGRVRISWKGNGEYFVCSSIDPSTGGRVLRVWSRDLVLHSTGESVSGLGRCVGWSPRGHLVAGTGLTPSGHLQVVFYETNGLRHGEFLCRGKETGWNVREILWNPDSTVLGLWLERNGNETSRNQNKTSRNGNETSANGNETIINEDRFQSVLSAVVQLWTCSNYHWYLKQELHPTQATPTNHTQSILSVSWDPIYPLRLHMFMSDGRSLTYDYKRCVSSSPSLSPSNHSSVAVIDGDQLLLTSFRHVVVPPPMSSAKLSFPSPVSMVTFAPPPNVNDIIVMMADGRMAVCKNNGSVAWNDPQILSVSFKNDMLFVYQLIWWKSDVLLGVTCKSHDTSCDPMSGSIVVEFQLSIDNLTVIESGSFPCEGLVQCFHGNHDTGSVAMEMADGKTYKYKGNGVMIPWLAQDGDHVTFGGTSCDQIASCMFDDDKECLVGLSTRTCQFFVNNVKVLSGCTSFAIHDQFILLTTNSHALQLVNRHGNPADVRVLSSDESLTGNGMGVASRRLERGSLLVGAVPHDLRVIIQMPRGNLEVISPRALVLSHIRQLLDKSLYGEAFYIMRKHRINLNLLCDHNMEYFISNNGGAWSLITQLDNPSYINLFLTDLREDDVVSTMYPNLSRPGSQTCTGTGWYGNGSKVNLVCKTMRDVLSSTDRNKYMLSIITTHIKMIPQELDEVLKLIKDIKDNPSAGVGPSVDEALKYSLLLIDVNQLYDSALGLYDFSLVLLVTEKSQKDPKEYLPFLNELRKLPLLYCRFKIDKYLKRYDKALNSISQMPDKFDECLEFVKEHKLYKNALKIYDRKSHEHHMISLSYGEYLSQREFYKESGLIYQACGELSLASAAFEKANQWELVLSISSQLGHSEEQIQDTARRISSHLKSRGEHATAADVLLEYSQDVDGAVRLLIEGGSWKKALRIIHRFNRCDMIDDVFKPSLVEAHNNYLMLIESQLELFNQRCARLNIVRDEKSKAILEGCNDHGDGSDLFSDTSSVTGQSVASSSNLSRATRTSAKSAKNRRKAERKKYSLKEGSRYEEIALLESLKDIITRADKLQDEVEHLSLMLCSFGAIEELKYLQEKFSQFFDVINHNIPLIWTTRITNNHASGPQSTANSILAALTAGLVTSNIDNELLDINSDVLVRPLLRKNINWKLNNFL